MTMRAFVLAVCVAVLIAGCAIGKPMPEVTTYIVESPLDQAVPPPRESLRVGSVRVAAPFAGAGLVYRFSDVRYASDPYNAFAADPAAMLSARITEWMEQADTASPSATSAMLDINVMELYGDFREGQRAAAVVALHVALVDESGPRRRVLYERSISRRIPLPEASAEALVNGYGTALAEVLSQLMHEHATQPSHIDQLLLTR